MNNSKNTQSTDEVRGNETDMESNLRIGVFAGSIVIIMGVLVLLSIFISDMPTGYPVDPVSLNLIGGGLYIGIGSYLIIRSK
jgi:hypothetical protein